MKIIKTNFEGLLVIKQESFTDRRGSLRIIYNKKIIRHNKFIFDYCTTSFQNALRGMHFQHKKPQAKYVNGIILKTFPNVFEFFRKSTTQSNIFPLITFTYFAC